MLSSRAWSLAELARHFSCSKATMLRLLDRIERPEGVALKSELRLDEGHWQKWYWLDRNLNSNERAHLKFSAEDMRLRPFDAPFLSAGMGRLPDDSLRRASALFGEGARIRIFLWAVTGTVKFDEALALRSRQGCPTGKWKQRAGGMGIARFSPSVRKACVSRWPRAPPRQPVLLLPLQGQNGREEAVAQGCLPPPLPGFFEDLAKFRTCLQGSFIQPRLARSEGLAIRGQSLLRNGDGIAGTPGVPGRSRAHPLRRLYFTY